MEHGCTNSHNHDLRIRASVFHSWTAPSRLRSTVYCLLFTLLLTACAGNPNGLQITLTRPPLTPTPPAPATALPVTPVATEATFPPPIVPTDAGTTTAETAVAPGPTPATAQHVVQPGETLLGLAQQYGVPMVAIQMQNDMGESTTVYAGQTLVIPPASDWPGASPYWQIHVVQAGETLLGIAGRYGFDASELQAVNGLADAGQIRVGQELILPFDAPAPAQPAPTTAPPPTSAPPANPTAGPPTVAAPAAPPADLAAWPAEVIRLINEVRAVNGLPPLTTHPLLTQAAQAHVDDCVARGWCSHTGSDGSDVRTRLTRVGYSFTYWSECWAQVQSPQAAIDIWMDEVPPNDPHRRTLLSTRLVDVGVGVGRAGWGYYFIADFGAP